jgi:hypothetical protein
MKRALTCILSALVAVSFSGGWATAYQSGMPGAADQMTSDTTISNDTQSPQNKDTKKKQKKTRRWAQPGTGSGSTPSGTGPYYGTANQGGAGGDAMGNPTVSPVQK